MDKFDVVVDGQKIEVEAKDLIKNLKDPKKQAFWDNFSRAWVQTEPEELPNNVLQFTREKK